MKNGLTFTSVIASEQFQSGNWDPYFYRDISGTSKLGDFVKVEKFVTRSSSKLLKYEPIEYKDIPRGNIIGFNLRHRIDSTKESKLSIIPENTLLFGTMRAYLGNVLVTPMSIWLDQSNCWFSVNSEFVIIQPNDGLTYFWWAYLKSPSFLATLPTGTGGTRPRSNAEQLVKIPVSIPSFEERNKINIQLSSISENFWRGTCEIHNILTSTQLI